MNSLSRVLERRPLRVNLTLGLSVLLAFAVGVGLINLQSQIHLIREIETLYQQEMLGVGNAKDAQMQYLLLGRELRQAALLGPGIEREKSLKTVSEIDDRLATELKELRPRLTTDSDIRLLTTLDRKSTRLNSSHSQQSRMPSSA